MFNYILKRFKKIVIRILALIFFLICLLIIFLYLNYRLNNKYPKPNDLYSYVENNKSGIYLNEKNKKYLKEREIWSIRLDKNGKVIESFNKPKKVKDKFDITDVARFTRFYLADYPVFTYIIGDGLILFVYPKNSLDKFPFNYYNYKNFIFNLELVFIFIILFIFFIGLILRIFLKTYYLFKKQ